MLSLDRFVGKTPAPVVGFPLIFLAKVSDKILIFTLFGNKFAVALLVLPRKELWRRTFT